MSDGWHACHPWYWPARRWHGSCRPQANNGLPQLGVNEEKELGRILADLTRKPGAQVNRQELKLIEEEIRKTLAASRQELARDASPRLIGTPKSLEKEIKSFLLHQNMLNEKEARREALEAKPNQPALKAFGGRHTMTQDSAAQVGEALKRVFPDSRSGNVSNKDILSNRSPSELPSSNNNPKRLSVIPAEWLVELEQSRKKAAVKEKRLPEPREQ